MKIILLLLLLIASPAWGAPALNELTAGLDATDRTGAYTTASITITADRLALLAIEGRTVLDVGIQNPTIGGTLSANWVLVGFQNHENVTSRNQLWVFRTMVGSNQVGTITITPGAGQEWAHAAWSVAEWSGVDTGGTDGSAAIVQTVTGDINGAAATAFSLMLAAFGSADNRPYLLAGMRTNQTLTPEAGYDTINTQQDVEGDSLITIWHPTVADLTPGITWTTTDQDVGGVAVEIKAAAAGGASPRQLRTIYFY